MVLQALTITGGDCCSRDYNLGYTDTAPYFAADYDTELFTLDGSVRRDTVDASGWAQAGGKEFNTLVDGVTIPTMLPMATGKI